MYLVGLLQFRHGSWVPRIGYHADQMPQNFMICSVLKSIAKLLLVTWTVRSEQCTDFLPSQEHSELKSPNLAAFGPFTTCRPDLAPIWACSFLASSSFVQRPLSKLSDFSTSMHRVLANKWPLELAHSPARSQLLEIAAESPSVIYLQNGIWRTFCLLPLERYWQRALQ